MNGKSSTLTAPAPAARIGESVPLNGAVDGEPASTRRVRLGQCGAVALVVVVALLVRANFVVDWCWGQPYEPHHVDEALLPYDALAMWEGVAPRDLGWPGSTNRILLSICYAIDMAQTTSLLSSPDGRSPNGVMNHVVAYTERIIDDPARLYVIGRWVSVAIGVLQVFLAWWALRRWGQPLAGVLAALMCALAPFAVSHSQYVLPDMAGVLFVTWLLGVLAPRPGASPLRPIGAGVLLGLAVASKHNFGIWVIPALLAIWMTPCPGAHPVRGRIRDSLTLLTASALIYLLLVPWVWTNPVYFVKEFLYTVGMKFRSGEAGAASPLENLAATFVPMGWLVLGGLVPGLFATWKLLGKRALPVMVLLVICTVAIARSKFVADRHGLMFFPAVVFVAALGYAWLLTARSLFPRAAGLGLLGVLTVVTGVQLWFSQQVVGEVESRNQAHTWFLAHMKPGDRIAVDDHYAYYLPQTREQIAAEIESYASSETYVRKIQGNGYAAHPGEPMRSAVLNDELFRVHWLRRELSLRKPNEGFQVTVHGSEVPSRTISTEEAIARFRQGLQDPKQGFDALLLRRPADLGVEPALVFRGGASPIYYLYLRPRQ